MKACCEHNCGGCLYKTERGCVARLLNDAVEAIDALIAALPPVEDCEACKIG